MSARDAQKIAYEKDLDLVKIAPGAKPPVCRIMDYGKYCFEQQKREKEARKNQKVVSIKEIRMFSAIDTHDFETKVNQAKKFLQGGDKLKVSVRFRKRAIAHPQIGEELLKRFQEACKEVGVVDKPAKMEGRSIQNEEDRNVVFVFMMEKSTTCTMKIPQPAQQKCLNLHNENAITCTI